MISTFLKTKVNKRDELTAKVAMCVSFWSRYLRNKDTVRYIDSGATAVSISMHGLALNGRPEYKPDAVDAFEQYLFNNIVDLIKRGETLISLYCDYDAEDLLAKAAKHALGNAYNSKLSFSYKTNTVLDVNSKVLKYIEGYGMPMFTINRLIDSNLFVLDGDIL